MGLLANAASLGTSKVFEDWVQAAIIYQAQVVLSEPDTTPDHPVRKFLAHQVLIEPHLMLHQFHWACATTGDIITAGGTPVAAHEQMILNRVAEMWTPIAKFNYRDSFPE